MVKQCRICHTTFKLYKSWVTTDDQLTCERCAKTSREKRDRDAQHRRDMERQQAAQRLRNESKQTICGIQRDVLIRQAEEKAKATVAEEERKSKESDNIRKIREAEEATRQKELDAQMKKAEEDAKIRIAEEESKVKVAQEATKQMELQLQIARVNKVKSDTESRHQLKKKEFDTKIAEENRVAKDMERRKAEADAKKADSCSESIRAFAQMDAQDQQRFSEAFGNRLNVEQENLPPQSRPVRKKAPWTALHCTIK